MRRKDQSWRVKEHRRYMPALDGLRALAVLAVILYHLQVPGTSGGLLGVTVFFVLSGYLITDLLLAEWEQTRRIDLKQFWIRRARRLLPAMLTMLILVIAYVTLFEPVYLTRLRGDVLAALLYVSNWRFVFQELSYFDSMQPSLFMHFWSLAVEEQFYLLWPVIVLSVMRYFPSTKKLRFITVFGGVISALLMAFMYEPGSDPSRVYYGTDTRAFSLLIGAALAIVWPSRKLSPSVKGKAKLSLDLAGIASLAVLLGMMAFSDQYDDFLYYGGMVLASLAAAIAVAVLAHPSSRLAAAFSWRPLRLIGVRSYGMYLWHFPVIVLTSPAVDTGEFNLIRGLFQLGLIFFITAWSYRYIERPIRKGALREKCRAFLFGSWGWRRVPARRWLSFTGALAVFLISMAGLYTAPASGADQPAEVKEMSVREAPNEDHSNAEEKQDKQAKEEPDETRISEVTAVGDSVMVDAVPFLKEYFPDLAVDAKVGRQMEDGIEVVRRFKEQGQLGDVIIIGLGTNGPFSKKQVKEIVESISGDPPIIFINTRVPRPWEHDVNARLKQITAEFSNVTLVNWHSESADHDHYFAPDGIHLSEEGAKAYAALISEAVKKL
ncbi:acyltransferase family protein [Bacillus xiapuensis]|uniref:acyltransferase family protein n=1 Tax=Bacillus xiapuensis TaxID=2014075 RepID=UPI000C24C0E0|nr:acyltransferase family protein [Bacillus xiapuensis]